nr:MAG TPA: Subunit of cleavage factor IA Pcf11 [Caudoviricetes sp.]
MEHKLGRAREKRPWFSRSWYISTEVMKDYMAQQLGSRFRAAFDNL